VRVVDVAGDAQHLQAAQPQERHACGAEFALLLLLVAVVVVVVGGGGVAAAYLSLAQQRLRV
jgi:Flp pilus assembly pilin Flp